MHTDIDDCIRSSYLVSDPRPRHTGRRHNCGPSIYVSIPYPYSIPPGRAALDGIDAAAVLTKIQTTKGMNGRTRSRPRRASVCAVQRPFPRPRRPVPLTETSQRAISLVPLLTPEPNVCKC